MGEGGGGGGGEGEKNEKKTKRVCQSIGQCIRGWAGGLVVQSVSQSVSQSVCWIIVWLIDCFCSYINRRIRIVSFNNGVRNIYAGKDTKATYITCCYALRSYVGTVFSHDKHLPPPRPGHKSSVDGAWQPCGGVIRRRKKGKKKKKKRRGHTHSPLAPWNALVSVQLHILGSP